MIKGFKWKQQDAAFVWNAANTWCAAARLRKAHKSRKKFEIIFFTQAVEVRGSGGWGGGCQPFHFWRSLGIAACLLVASLAPCRPRARLVTGLVV